jgi:hypothetical protein
LALSIARGGISQALDGVARNLTPTSDALVERVQSAAVAAEGIEWSVDARL